MSIEVRIYVLEVKSVGSGFFKVSKQVSEATSPCVICWCFDTVFCYWLDTHDADLLKVSSAAAAAAVRV